MQGSLSLSRIGTQRRIELACNGMGYDGDRCWKYSEVLMHVYDYLEKETDDHVQ